MFWQNRRACPYTLLGQTDWSVCNSIAAGPVLDNLLNVIIFLQNTEKAKEEILAVMKTLNDTLATKTFLVGERITLADISVVTNLLLAYQWVMEPAFRSPFPNVNRWFETVVNQPQVKKALPADFKMCEKMAQFDGKRFSSEVSLFSPLGVQ